MRELSDVLNAVFESLRNEPAGWVYVQATGELLLAVKDDSGAARGSVCAGRGYSGFGAGVNNPECEHIHNVGPIPRGSYALGTPYDSPTHGPLCIPLIPFPENRMYGRSGFLMHGDSIKAPGLASQGCIIQARAVRERVASDLTRVLRVV